MTPPDSDADTRILLCKQHGNLGCMICDQPDPDAREVSTAGCAHKPDWLTCELCNPALSVSLPLPLAQRILAALERDIWTELAAELRAVIGK